MFVEISVKMIRFFVTVLFSFLFFSCQRIERQEFSSENKADTSELQNVILDQQNPFRMRDSIKHYAIIPNVSINAKIKILHNLQDSLQKVILSDQKNKFSEIDKLNYLIVKYIANLIEIHNIEPNRLARKNIKFIQSANKKLGILSWDENTGSAFQSFINILIYRTKNNKFKTHHLEWINRKKEYPPYAGKMTNINRLGMVNGQDIYMIFSEGIGCSDCLQKTFIGLSLASDTIDLNYPLFVDNSDLIVDSKNDNLILFNYFPNHKKIMLKMYTDTIIDNHIVPLDTIFKEWIFGGEVFLENTEE
jgi:hypothetical protein